MSSGAGDCNKVKFRVDEKWKICGIQGKENSKREKREGCCRTGLEVRD